MQTKIKSCGFDVGFSQLTSMLLKEVLNSEYYLSNQ
uniref:Uncharacterized protein n=1 Tax=Arundo donax TaxID=35708 RepID=A0A0A9AUG0_ARUDO